MSSNIAMEVHGLGKKYRVGALRGQASSYKRLTETIVDTLKSPFRRLQPGGASATEEFWALKDVSFTLPKGEVLGVIGRNGAGKSTLLKILSRVTNPSEGRARMYGRIGSLLEVGTGFHPELTGRENIYLNGTILGMRKAEIDRNFDEIVAFAGVEKFLDTPVKRYSSGMYVRLAFAVAAHLETEILLVDEVLAVGDIEFQKKCLGKMQGIANEGRTILFVSHNMNAVEDLCRCALLLEHGSIAAISNDVRSVIVRYLTSGQEGSREWINTRGEYNNPYFQPSRLAVVDKYGKNVPMPIRNDDEIYIQLEGHIQTLDPALTIGYAVFTDTGQLLYWSYQTDTEQTKWPQLEVGDCILRGRLPAHLLNEGNYRIELVGGIHYIYSICEVGVNAPSINIEIQGGLSDSPYWMYRRPTLLAPVIEWTRVNDS
jgi:lipopolysaccharide transport system ATP-binding protein